MKTQLSRLLLSMCIATLAGCGSSMPGPDDSLDEAGILRPKDLGIEKHVYSVSHQADEVAVFEITYPIINPSDASQVNYHICERVIYSEDGMATESISIINRSLLSGRNSSGTQGTHGFDFYINLGNGLGVALNHYYPADGWRDSTSGQNRFGKQYSFGEDLADVVTFGFEMKVVKKDDLEGLNPELLNRHESWKHDRTRQAEQSLAGDV